MALQGEKPGAASPVIMSCLWMNIMVVEIASSICSKIDGDGDSDNEENGDPPFKRWDVSSEE
jgi:hypothetical protein